MQKQWTPPTYPAWRLRRPIRSCGRVPIGSSFLMSSLQKLAFIEPTIMQTDRLQL